MKVDPIFDESKTYTVSELAEVFDVVPNTIRRWADKEKLPADRDHEGVRTFHGARVMRAVKNDDHLLQKLSEAHGVADESDQLRQMIDTIESLRGEVDQKEEELARRSELSEILDQKFDELAGRIEQALAERDERIEKLESMIENRLPAGNEPDPEESSGWWPF